MPKFVPFCLKGRDLDPNSGLSYVGIWIAQSRQSAFGHIEPKDECPVFGRAVAERTVANPPKTALSVHQRGVRFGGAAPYGSNGDNGRKSAVT